MRWSRKLSSVPTTDVPTQSKTTAPWPDGYDLLAFCCGVFVFIYAGLFVAWHLSQLLGIASPPEEQTVFRFGGTAVLIWLLFVGSFSFLIGGFFVRWLKRARARWLSAAVGASYSLIFVSAAPFISIAERGVAGRLMAVFLLLFPAIGLLLGALMLKRAPSGPAP